MSRRRDWRATLAACPTNLTRFEALAQYHDAPFAVPTHQPELTFDSVKTLAEALPLTLLPEPLDLSLDARRLLELDEIALPNRFPRGHHASIAEGDVAAHQDGAFPWTEPIAQLPQTSQARFGCVAIAAPDFHIEHRSQVTHPTGMQVWLERPDRLGLHPTLAPAWRPSSILTLVSTPRIQGRTPGPARALR